MDAAIRKEEVAPRGMHAAKAADLVLAADIVAGWIVAESGRTSRAAVHRLIRCIGGQTELSGHCQDAGVPGMPRIAQTGGAPGLLHRRRAIDNRLRDRLPGVLE